MSESAEQLRYRAHVNRARALAAHAPTPWLAEYWRGYHIGMARGGRPPVDRDEEQQDERMQAALRGEESDLDRLARACGDHDGRHWDDVTAHRGLLRLAVTVVAGGSVRGLALGTLSIDEASVRQMLSGKRPIPATRYHELLDYVSRDTG